MKLSSLLLENAKYRLVFLGLSKLKRDAIVKPDLPANEFEEKSKELEGKITSGEKSKEKIDEAKQKANVELKEAQSVNDKKVAETKLEIENYRSSLADVSIRWIEDLKLVVDKYQSISTKLDEVEGLLASRQSFSKEDYSIIYSKITLQWRTLIDDAYVVYYMIKSSSSVQKPPELANDFLKNISEHDSEMLLRLRNQALEERQNFLNIQIKKIYDHFNDFYYLLARSSKVRSDVLNVIEILDFKDIYYDENYFKDLSREFIAIPFRFFGIFYQRYLTTKSSLDQGFWGLVSVVKNVFLLFLIILLPFASRSTAIKIRRYLDRRRVSLLKRHRMSDRKILSIALLLQRVTPYLPWLLYGSILRVFYIQIEGTTFEDLQIIVPVFGYIILYKIFRLLVSDLFYSIRNLAHHPTQNTRNLVNVTSKTIGFYFLFAYILIHLTEQTVDKGLLYRNISGVLELMGLILCAVATNWWKDNLAPAIKTVSPNRVGNFLSEKCQSKFSLFFCLPTLVFILLQLIADKAWNWISAFEISKRFLAKVFRRKIESLVGNNKASGSDNLPVTYTQLFSGNGLGDANFLVSVNQSAYKRIKSEIDGWLSEDEEDQSIAIYGEKGIGKTTLLDQLSLQFNQLNIVRISIPPKIWQKDALASFFSESFGLDKGDNFLKTVLGFNKKLEKKTLILVDDAHNLFLGQYGGFEALNSYIEAVNLKTDKLFWCSVFNEYAWAYIKGVLGSSQYLRTEIYLGQWTDEAIKELILKRHLTSEFALSYDQMILASRTSSAPSDAAVYAEEQFFRLLWEQANGNPRVALYLWINCLSPMSSHTFRVGLPERPEAEVLSTLNEDCWFVLAAIAKHDNITRKEAVAVTNLDWSQVATAIKLGIENKLLHRDGNRYRLHFTHQHDVLRQLKVKNFIYGIS
ncbi:MAG: ATP-binding protein [Bdellovibrionota bacterium]